MKNIFSISMFALLCMLSCGAEKLEVRTFPDGYRDNRVGSIFSDAPSVLLLHTWAKEKAFRSDHVRIMLTLPENIRIGHFSIGRSSRGKGNITSESDGNGGRKWTLSAGRVNYKSVYKLSAHQWRPEVPWTDSSVVVFISPEGEVPSRFTASWEIAGSNIETIAGEMKFFTLSAPKLTAKPKNLSVWSRMGMYSGKNSPGAWTTEYYLAVLHTMRDAGVTGIMESGGNWLPHSIYPVSRLHSDFGFETIALNCLSYSQRTAPEAMSAAGFKVMDSDIKINAAGRTMREKKQCPKQMFCYSAMQEKDSPVRAYMRFFYQKYIDKGFRIFFSDYEPSIYDCCYCEKCRRAFAVFSGVDEKKCLNMKAGELAAEYPFKWYLFRCDLYGRFLKLLGNELGVPIGWNSNIVNNDIYLPPLKSFGWSGFAEDPRIFDKYVAFHNADTLATGVGSIMGVAGFMQKYPDGRPVLSKPVIARATSLHWVNWGFICIYGRYDFALAKGFKGLGVDFRRKLHKLEIASDFSLGVAGVEVSASPFSADAEALTGIAEGIQFAVDFEDYIKPETRLPCEMLKLYDCTATPSPYAEIMKQGYLSNWFKLVTDKYGLIHSAVHGEKDWRFIALFNWDYHQAKKLRFIPENLPEGRYFLNISIDNRKAALPRLFSVSELKKGIMIELPSGGMAGILISKKKVFSEAEINLPSHMDGREIKFRLPVRSGKGPAAFIGKTYNPQIRLLMKKYPEAKFREVEVAK